MIIIGCPLFYFQLLTNQAVYTFTVLTYLPVENNTKNINMHE